MMPINRSSISLVPFANLARLPQLISLFLFYLELSTGVYHLLLYVLIHTTAEQQ